MNLTQWLQANKAKFDISYERVFATEVLGAVQGLDFKCVSTQTWFYDLEGFPRRSDFQMEDADGVRIIIEVSGYNATESTKRDFDADGQKAIARQKDGWLVFQWPNSTFSTGPRDDPRPIQSGCERLTAIIEATIADQRSSYRALHEVPILRARVAELEAKSSETRVARTNVPREAAARVPLTRAVVLRQEADVAAMAYSSASTSNRHEYALLGQQLVKAVDDLRREVEHLQSGLPATPLLSTEPPATRSARHGLRWIAGLAVGAVLATGVAALGVAWWSSDPATTVASSDNRTAGSVGLDCDTTIEWGFAAACVGKSITTKGPVAGGSYRHSTNGQPTFLNIGNDFPNKSRLEVVIWANCRENFPVAPETVYRGKTVYVTGKVSMREGVAQIEVCNPRQITAD